MSVLFAQNIPFGTISKIGANSSKAKQVRQLGVENYSDIEIRKYAKENKCTVVTFDADFFDLSNFKGYPSKIFWLRFRNTSADFLTVLLNLKNQLIKDFINSHEYSQIACLEVIN